MSPAPSGRRRSRPPAPAPSYEPDGAGAPMTLSTPAPSGLLFLTNDELALPIQALPILMHQLFIAAIIYRRFVLTRTSDWASLAYLISGAFDTHKNHMN